ncbi:hypothetical protein ACJBYX_05170 [Streptococcus suis]|uniref:hypothetical protein n=1 Tax=Streptococcus suis TaxID=1307 RepID=UPI001F0648B2|nr:hypothetical protein [Streptococcus suis]MCH1637384.1 hypothetical protein [Streptococcus suis]MCH1648229.1 hypothetical protein [Streptococcus suis]HEM3072153.1 hypothetical protein [Streptococcus suis]HEM3090277.1 hypothetical protein [Streptococcus suis]HEM3100192.1 hypothetical protein [Streptococcus suis]
MAGILNLFKHKLVVVEFGVEAVKFKKLAVVALLDNFSVFEDDDFIRKSGSISLV